MSHLQGGRIILDDCNLVVWFPIFYVKLLFPDVVWYVVTSVSEKIVTSIFNTDDFFWDMRSCDTVGLPTC